MATFSSIRTAIKTTLGSISNLRVFDTVDDMINVPAAVLIPSSINFTEAMARGTDRYEFDLIVVVSRADARSGQNQLDGFINEIYLKIKRVLITTLIIVSIIILPFLPFDNLKFLKHALEGNVFLGVIIFYLLTHLMWKKNIK